MACSPDLSIVSRSSHRGSKGFWPGWLRRSRWRRCLVSAHRYVYTLEMRRRELERQLRDLGWKFLRHGRKHDVWTDGERQEPVPRHAEINEKLAKVILNRAKGKV